MSEKVECRTCRFWAGHISGRVQTPGICKRYPPALTVTLINMRAEDWCGEHQPATTRVKESNNEG